MSRRVVFDLRAIQSRHHGERGIGRYVLALARAVERVDPSLVTDYLIDPAFPIPPGASVAITSGKALRADDVPVSYRTDGGVFLMSSPFEEANNLETILPMWARGDRWRSTAVLYDLIPLLFPEKYLASHAARIAYVARTALIRQADRLFAISEASRHDAVNLLGVPEHKIDVIYAGADPAFERPLAGASVVRDRLVESGLIPGLRTSFLLFTGGPDYRKNIVGLLEAFSLLDEATRAANQLVVVCKLDEASRMLIEAEIARFGVGLDVLLTGFVDDRTLVALTQAATLVVFPSLYEGFGLPVLEAQQCGTPVICSDNSSLVEVQTLAAARFDPTSPRSIADAIVRALNDQELRELLSHQTIDPKHSWSEAGRVTATGLRELSDGIPPHKPKPTVSVIHAGPSSKLSHRVISFLEAARERFEIHLVEIPHHDAPTLPAAQKVVSDQTRRLLLAEPTDFVWWLASGPEMPPTLSEAFRNRPGLLLVDDADMRSLYGVGLDDFEPGASAALGAFYPGRYNTLADGSVDAGVEASIRAGMLCAKELVKLAPEVFCLSSFLGALIGVDTGRTVPSMRSERPEPTPARGPTELITADGSPITLVIDLQGANEPVEAAIGLAVERLANDGHSVVLRAALDVDDEADSSATTVYLFLPRMHYGAIPDRAVEVIKNGGAVIAERSSAFAEYGHPQVQLLDEGYQTADLAAAILAGATQNDTRGSLWTEDALRAGVEDLYAQLVGTKLV